MTLDKIVNFYDNSDLATRVIGRQELEVIDLYHYGRTMSVIISNHMSQNWLK